VTDSGLPGGVVVTGAASGIGRAAAAAPRAAAAARGAPGGRRGLFGRGTRAVVAVVVGAIGDPGRDLLARSLDVPVVGIGQASILAAAAGGRRGGGAAPTPNRLATLPAQGGAHGKSAPLTGCRV
jgi:allantoin racemase